MPQFSAFNFVRTTRQTTNKIPPIGLTVFSMQVLSSSYWHFIKMKLKMVLHAKIWPAMINHMKILLWDISKYLVGLMCFVKNEVVIATKLTPLSRVQKSFARSNVIFKYSKFEKLVSMIIIENIMMVLTWLIIDNIA